MKQPPIEKPADFKRFEDAVRCLVSVPKSKVDEEVKKFHELHKRKKTKKRT